MDVTPKSRVGFRNKSSNVYLKNPPRLLVRSISCSKLADLTLPESVTIIGDKAFAVCGSLTSIGPVGSGADLEIPNGVSSIRELTFANCKNLTTVVIPKSVVRIEYAAFKSCASLESFTLHSNVENIGGSLFRDCLVLFGLAFEGTESQWRAINKSGDWNKYSAIKEIICSNSTIRP